MRLLRERLSRTWSYPFCSCYFFRRRFDVIDILGWSTLTATHLCLWTKAPGNGYDITELGQSLIMLILINRRTSSLTFQPKNNSHNGTSENTEKPHPTECMFHPFPLQCAAVWNFYVET